LVAFTPGDLLLGTATWPCCAPAGARTAGDDFETHKLLLLLETLNRGPGGLSPGGCSAGGALVGDRLGLHPGRGAARVGMRPGAGGTALSAAVATSPALGR